MPSRGKRLALGLVVLLVAGCGGGDSWIAAPARRAAALPATALEAAALMDWAETEYAPYFPGHPATATATVGTTSYTYRAYPLGDGRTNYLGVTADGAVHVLGPDFNGGQLWVVGTLADFTCRVRRCAGSVSGTAAAGAPLVGATVTLKDSANRSTTATTVLTGAYTLDTTGLAPPFLLQVATPGGQRLHSVATGTATASVANLTPVTDLIVRSWYAVQGMAADAAFADPVGAPAPSRQQAAAAAEPVWSMLRLALDGAGAGVAAPLDLIAKPFAANHTGLDDVLDRTTITYGAATTVSVATAGGRQTSVLAYDVAGSTIASTSTTVSGADTTTSSISALVPVQGAQAGALGEIAAMLDGFGSIVNARRTSLAAADLMPYLDPGLLHDGRDRLQYAAMLAGIFGRGQTFGASIRRLTSLDAAAGRAEAVVDLAFSLGGQSMVQRGTFVFRRIGGAWLFSGNQRIAQVEVQAEASTRQGASSGGGPLVNVSVLAPPGVVRSASAVGASGILSLGQHSTVVDEGGMTLDQFNGEQGQSPAALPPAGTRYTVTLTRSDGTTTSYVEAIDAFTTEGVRITSPTGSSLADAHLDGTLNVSWALPTTYAIASVQLSGTAYTGEMDLPATYRCETPWAITSTTATSASLSVAGTCNGQPVRIVDLLLVVTGANGEQSQTHYTLR